MLKNISYNSLSHMLKTRDCIMYYAHYILDLINGTETLTEVPTY